MLLWVPSEPWLNAFLFGCGVLLIFGVWDDCKELGHYVKFLGQLLAVIPVVYYSDLYISHFPFMGLDTISPQVGKPFTVFAIMGMINAINHSDGLDGLAGGMTMLSLVCIGYLAFLAEGSATLAVAAATMGGIFGFLRFNNHPARVFMGDGGSQVLGYTLGVLVVVLTQNVNPALSPASPVLILGLPIIDILAVFWLRARGGLNWFKATKNHIHHRLLDLGFDHYEAVVIIYFIQVLFVVSAITLKYESDWLIMLIYMAVCTLIFILLTVGEAKAWSAHGEIGYSRLDGIINSIKNHYLFQLLPEKYIGLFIPGLFLVVAIMAKDIPIDLAVSSVVLAIIFLVFLLVSHKHNSLFIQIAIYITAAFIVYLETRHVGIGSNYIATIELAYFLPMVLVIGLAIRYTKSSTFKVSTMDYLVVVIAVLSGVFLRNDPSLSDMGFMVIKLAIVFYGSEFIINHMRTRWNLLTSATVLSLTMVGIKGLF
ncbi:MAG: undecaprenyl/decaprenyl-phosphate alpha-N-acetylglucosaminyl 1-phosphate transferase [Candidatus Heimdallarchaeota archaeon]|nr:undecaprenyl/decaprenyl-phosphate alpha-N-acetylglucosaminyl 1-phosphate transferase [Candidatus Heimdallarchaeota archaeon]